MFSGFMRTADELRYAVMLDAGSLATVPEMQHEAGHECTHTSHKNQVCIRIYLILVGCCGCMLDVYIL